MTFPGSSISATRAADWPGDTILPTAPCRTPIWQRGEYVTPDQYEMVRDSRALKYGTARRRAPGRLPLL